MPDGMSVPGSLSDVAASRVRAYLAAAADLDPQTLQVVTMDQFRDIARTIRGLRGDVLHESICRGYRGVRAGLLV